jgi:hypothetical protein
MTEVHFLRGGGAKLLFLIQHPEMMCRNDLKQFINFY